MHHQNFTRLHASSPSLHTSQSSTPHNSNNTYGPPPGANFTPPSPLHHAKPTTHQTHSPQNPLHDPYTYYQQPHPHRPLSAASKTASIRSTTTLNSFLTGDTRLNTPDFATPADTKDPTATSNIRVVVRIRPKTDYEISRENSPHNTARSSRVEVAAEIGGKLQEERMAISPMGDGRTLCLVEPCAAAKAGGRQSMSNLGCVDGGGEGGATNVKTLTFHSVYEEHADQEHVFNECGVKDLIRQAINGYAATIFAFGQTGSGKTFTITGPEVGWNLYPERLGIIPRALEFLFSELQTSPSQKYTIRATYLEIYNELVQDLLSPLANPNASLPVRWTAERGFYVENTITVECQDLDDCMAVLEEGLKNRTTGAHRLNEYSSRSHSIMTVYIDCEGEGGVVGKRGKISFVDLAGSERVRESRAKGDTLTETMSINKSLLMLGNCISALADPRKRNGHIPYRDSNLTKLLSDSLGGSGLALMIACISPSQVKLGEARIKHTSRTSLPETDTITAARLPPLAPSPAAPRSKIPTPPKHNDFSIIRHVSASLESMKDAIPSKRNARIVRASGIKQATPPGEKPTRSEAGVMSASSASSSQRRQREGNGFLERGQGEPKSPLTRDSATTLASFEGEGGHEKVEPFVLDCFNNLYPLGSVKDVSTLKQMIANDVDALDREIDMLTSGQI
ncbi:Kinesin- protein 12 [Podochytrium sp. JEL0797]|nr:Kinesin- protein 12 [Podochytrium sp. JEL0797]